jgi:outer membrane protein OmpA-like peptidoglycan-associated protein
VKSSGDVSGDASAEVMDGAGGSADGQQTKQAITFREGKLDYEGVINFEYNKASLRADADTKTTLAEFKKFLDQHSTVKIRVEGHTDSRGSDDYNRDLSDRRAASVREWLLANGVAEDRVTSVGKGEDDPQVAEPAECDDNVPPDTTPCEEPWAKNRRVVFQVTQGAETLPAETPPPAPEAPAETASPAPVERCPWLWGGHLNLLGTNSWLMLAAATQPGICWLELSLGVGLGSGGADAEAMTVTGDGSYVAFTLPLRARLWFMDRHALIADAGLGFTHYRISADLADAAGGTGSYTRNTTPVIANLGIGYGYRPNGANAGPRFALAVGGLLHLTGLGDSSIETGAAFADGNAIQAALDRRTNELDDLEPYAEASFGWLF